VLPSSCYSQEEEKTPRGFVKNVRSNNTCACLLQHLIATTSTRAQKTLRKKKGSFSILPTRNDTNPRPARERKKTHPKIKKSAEKK
jgi:hypothetical protein